MLSWTVEWRIACYVRLQIKRRLFAIWHAKMRRRRRARRLLCGEAFMKLPTNRRVAFNVLLKVMHFCRGLELWAREGVDSRQREALSKWKTWYNWCRRVIDVWAGPMFKRKMPMRYNTAFTLWVAEVRFRLHRLSRICSLSHSLSLSLSLPLSLSHLLRCYQGCWRWLVARGNFTTHTLIILHIH
jgi:hypothetical protein